MEYVLMFFAGYYGIGMLIGGIDDFIHGGKDYMLSFLGGIALCTCLAFYIWSVDVRTFLNETFRSTEDCTEWYAEEMYDAAKDGEISEFRDLKSCLMEWISDFDVEDIHEFDHASMQWSNNNKSKLEFMINFEAQYIL